MTASDTSPADAKDNAKDNEKAGDTTVAGAPKGLRNATGAALERYLDDQIQALADDLEQFAATLVDTLDNSEPRLRQTFRSSIDPLSRSVTRLADRLREQQSRELLQRGRQMIAAHPLAIVGGAAALVGGLAQLAVLASRRMEPQAAR